MPAPLRWLLWALAVLALAGLGFVASTWFAPGTWVAKGAPCPRNWGWAPAWQPRSSPLRAVRFALGDGHVKVCWGSPSLRGRTMLGGEAVPYGKLWRTGANEPTTIHSDRPFRLGPLALPAGSHALYSVPGAERWEIVVNGATRQWGLESEYGPEVAAREEGRFEVPVESLDQPLESLNFRLETTLSSGGHDLVVEWQTHRVRLPLAAAN